MNAVFADTSFFLALVNPRDQYHPVAAAMEARLNAPLITTEWILLEFANAISATNGRRYFEGILGDLGGQRDGKIIGADSTMFKRGCDLYNSRSDKKWSLTDCISFLVMETEGLSDALTSDRHFEQAGFKALLIR
jgi:uncharacterized protein